MSGPHFLPADGGVGGRLMGKKSAERGYSHVAEPGVGEQDGDPSGPREVRQEKLGLGAVEPFITL